MSIREEYSYLMDRIFKRIMSVAKWKRRPSGLDYVDSAF